MNYILPKENEIALFRYRNRLMAGVCVNISHTRARFAVSARTSHNVPIENILQTTGHIGNDKTAGAAWLNRAETTSADIDLCDLWELVVEEDEIWHLNELAELYYNNTPTSEHMSAFLVALETSIHFDAEGRGFCAVDRTEVSHRLEVIARGKEREAEREAFLKWLQFQGTGNDDWINRLKDVAIYGEQSKYAHWLERMAGETLSARKAFDRLVAEGVWDQHAFVELMREDIPLNFPDLLIKEAGEIQTMYSGSQLAHRQDLTYLDAVTIDDASTTDMDDAISVQFREDGSYQVGVHITDVSTLIPAHSTLDEEAGSRGASLYLPEAKYPMLPPVLSENLGSLIPHENRLAVSLLWNVEPDGTMETPTWTLSVIRCCEKLSYDEADAILDDVTHPRHAMLSSLFDTAESLLIHRVEAGAIAVDQVDRRVDISADGTVNIELKKRDANADLLVSELMVKANVEAAKLCVEQNAPAIFRVQDAPDLSDLEPTDIEQLHRYRVLTRMRAAAISLQPGLHGGLGVEPYCQTTSPLRRFLDLISQRQLVAIIDNKALPYSLDDLTELCPYVEERLRLINRLEQRRERYWIYHHLSQYRGRVFDALVLNIWDQRARIEILDYALQVDMRLSGQISAGERISVRLTRVDPWADDIQFVMES